MKKLTLEDFIETSNKIYDNKFDYSKAEYISDRTPVIIICKKHGEFLQTPLTHKNGSGCPYCKVEKQKEKFIKKANIVHNNKYDYSKVVYTNNKTPVVIICPEHGEFTQRPDNHLHGAGCFRCGVELRGINQRLSTEDFVARAKEIHNNKYTYNKTIYYKTDEKVVITCPIHGDFLQTPNIHLGGCGCPKCKSEASSIREKSTKEEFIQKANVIHNNKYSYNKVNYIDGHTKVVITCPKHGDFIQKPCLHLNHRQGCPKCGIERMMIANGNENTDHLGNKFNSIAEKCKHWHIPMHTYRARIDSGWTELEALTCPTQMSISEYRIHNYLSNASINHKFNVSLFNVFNSNNLKGRYKNGEIKKICQTISLGKEFTCKSLGSLKYDFVIFDKNNKLDYIIEFDGLQHFKEIDVFHKSNQDFQYRLFLDKLKEQFAQEFDIPIFRIRYDQINEYDKILETIINQKDKYNGEHNPLIPNKKYWNIKP